jgi:hypothetical protein
MRMTPTREAATLASAPLLGATALVIQQENGGAIAPGTEVGDRPWLYVYRCRTATGMTTCSNKIGDSYRYRVFPMLMYH